MFKSLITALAVFAAFSTVQAQNEAAIPPPTDAQIAMVAVTADTVDMMRVNWLRKKQATERSKNSLKRWFAIIRQ